MGVLSRHQGEGRRRAGEIVIRGWAVGQRLLSATSSVAAGTGGGSRTCGKGRWCARTAEAEEGRVRALSLAAPFSGEWMVRHRRCLAQPVDKSARARQAARHGLKSGRVVYFSTWGGEGSRDRHPGERDLLCGTPMGEVAPGRREGPSPLGDSGPETAFLARYGKPSARMAQRHPAAEQPS
jgi:hypothetical protein